MLNETSCSLCRAGYKPTRLKRQKIHHDRATGRIVLCEEQPFMSDGSKRTDLNGSVTLAARRRDF